MAKLDWSILGSSQKGLAVEGQDDKDVIEAFLDAGEKQKYWSDWRAQVQVVVAGSSTRVLDEVKPQADGRVWGLIDRDWRTNAEIQELVDTHPHLLILPRIMIENYCIDPIELEQMLPPPKRFPSIRADIEAHLDAWLQNGALWSTLYEQGAFQFCRGHEDGYPMALLHSPVLDETDIHSQFTKWHNRLETADVLPRYRTAIGAFRTDQAQNYTRHIHGKNFFSQVIVREVLNRKLGQQPETAWFNSLFKDGEIACPADIVPVLQTLVS